VNKFAGAAGPGFYFFATDAAPGPEVPGYEAYSWVGIIAPARMPKEIIARLNREIVDILRIKQVADGMTVQGVVPVGGSPEHFAAYMKAEIAKWGAVVRAANITAD
jgi:tripartite-type tricarboxylate transporter receptor subunit TctC